RCFLLLFRAADFVALDPFTQGSLDRRQDSVAPFCVLPTLLVVTQPKRSINADKNEQQFGPPATQPRKRRTLFRCLAHCSISNGFAIPLASPAHGFQRAGAR